MQRILLVALAVLLLPLTPVDAAPTCAPGDFLFDYTWHGDILRRVGKRHQVQEPSGICYYAPREELLVVCDEGFIHTFPVDGKGQPRIRELKRSGRTDFEGVTYNPATGLIYIGVEDDEVILEVDPDELTIIREFPIDTTLPNGRKLASPDNEGLEALCFIPDDEHPEGGWFLMANQSYSIENNANPSALLKIKVPLREGGAATIAGIAAEPGVPDLAGLHFDATTKTLFAVADAHNILLEFAFPSMELRNWYLFTGRDQEGITTDGRGTWWIAQDSGGVVKVTWNRASE